MGGTPKDGESGTSAGLMGNTPLRIESEVWGEPRNGERGGNPLRVEGEVWGVPKDGEGGG